ncbi:glycosyltransferase [Saccharothrix sp. AJ9571]|nr:glycosyltransferase [Saccharothrix sp. AJ9571]
MTRTPVAHVVVPSVHDPAVAKGGTCFYRSVVEAAALAGPVRCYEGARPNPRQDSVGQLGDDLRHHVRRGDVVLKCAGALGVATDSQADFLVPDLGAHSLYLDADAPFRLPHLSAAHPLAQALPSYSGILLFAGGSRAEQQYRLLCSGTAPDVTHISPALYGFTLPGGISDHDLDRHRDLTLLVPVAAHSSRESRVIRWLGQLVRNANGVRVGLVGDWPITSALPGVIRLPMVDPLVLQRTYRRAEFTLNLLRPEFPGYTDTVPARLFEAALAGSVLVTEQFDGLAEYLEPGVECLTFRALDEVPALLKTTEAERRRMAQRARERVVPAIGRAARQLAAIVSELAGTGPPEQPGLSPVPPTWPPRAAYRPGAWAAVLPATSERFVALLRSRLPDLRFRRVDDLTDLAPGALLVVAAGAKNEMDEQLRRSERVVPAVIADASDTSDAANARWIPGRDWVLPEQDHWPWQRPARSA